MMPYMSLSPNYIYDFVLEITLDDQADRKMSDSHQNCQKDNRMNPLYYQPGKRILNESPSFSYP
jgi:hypothetical protein